MYKDHNPEHWKMAVFCYNRDNPHLFVARRSGVPFTLNFARPGAWLVTAATIALIVFAVVINNR